MPRIGAQNKAKSKEKYKIERKYLGRGLTSGGKICYYIRDFRQFRLVRLGLAVGHVLIFDKFYTRSDKRWQ